MHLFRRSGAFAPALVMLSAGLMFGCADASSPTKVVTAEDTASNYRWPWLSTVSSLVVTLDSTTLTAPHAAKASFSAKDRLGQPVTNKVPTWSSSDSSVAKVSSTGLVTGLKAGSATIQAIIDGVKGGATLTVKAGPSAPATAAALAVATQPSGAMSGVAFTTQPAVKVLDNTGAVMSGSTLAVTAAVASGTGTLSGTMTATAKNGVATFTNLMITGGGTSTLKFSATGVTAATSNAITVGTQTVPAKASLLSITSQPSATVASGAALAQQPIVQLRDASNNAVSQSGVVVTAAIATGGGTLGGTPTATTNANGVASFSGLTITGTAGARTLSFSAPSLTSATSSAINVTVTTAPPPPPAGAGEPVYDASTGTMVMQDNMDGYSTATAMGSLSGSGKRIIPLPSPAADGGAVNTNAVSVVSPGRSGSGNALRMSYPGGSAQASANFMTMNTVDQPTLATQYYQYWGRVKSASALTRPLAVKWFEAWHFQNDRIQWNTHDHLPWTGGSSTKSYWQIYDQGHPTASQGTQPVGPYLDDVNDSQWHRYTLSYRPNSAAGKRDGFARMWVDGVKVIDISAATIGVTPAGGNKVWCNADDVDALANNDGIRYVRWGSTQTTDSPPWTYDIDDFMWWVVK